MSIRDYFQKHVALPSEHGSWVMLLGPLVIGLAAAPKWSMPTLYLVVAAICGFLARQPITLAVKSYSGRRSRDGLPAAFFWIAVYGGIALLFVAGLLLRGYGFVLYLALPGVAILAWHLFLIARRAERRQQLVEIVAGGVLALSAPAVYWIGVGEPEPTGWWLWALTWAQSATAIVYAYLRLSQRPLSGVPAWGERLRMGRHALLWSTGSLSAVLGLGVSQLLPAWLFVAYAVQWMETLYGVARPAIGIKPKAVGWRQLTVSVLFTVLFIATWR